MNDIREELRAIFRELLGTDAEIDDDALFIELGGQSVLMGMLQNELQHKTGVFVPFENMFTEGSVNGLAEYISSHKSNVIYGYGNVDFVPEPEKRYEKFPLTGLQTAYYVGRKEDTELGGNPTRGYSEIICTEYDRVRMENALNRLIAAHDIFRLIFNDDVTQQVLETNEYYVLEEDDISALSEEEQRDFIEKKRNRIFNTLFDITKLPLVRFETTKIAPDRAVLHFSHDGLIIDGWSHEKLIHDLDRLYGDNELELGSSGVLFRDYVNYLERVRETKKYQDDREWWLSRDIDKYEKPELPVKCEPSEVREVNTRQVFRVISGDVWEGVKRYAAEKGLTPFSLLMTAYGKALSKYSSNNNFLISIPASIRPDICDDIDDLLGECSNFFICGFRNSIDASILDTARENQKQIYEVMQHNAFMGTDYIRELQRTNGANIVAPVVFTSMIDTPERENKYLSKVYTKTHTSQIWIDAIAMKKDDGIMLLMDCTEQMFASETTDAIGDTFVKILELYASGDEYIETKCSAPLLDRELEIASDCINGRMDYEVPDLGEMLYASYLKNKDRPAVICNDRVTTYEEFYQEAYCIAREISKIKGFEERSAAGLFMDKCKYQPISSIAANLLNSPFLPLDIQYSTDHIAYCIEKAGIKVIITDDMHWDRLYGKVNCELINVDRIKYTYDNEIRFAPGKPDDSAFIINTSGTTGKPKSVDLKRDGLVNCVLETKLRFGLDENDRFFAITNYCHDMSVYDIYGALTCGGAMVIPDHDKQKDPEHWLYLISTYGITFWNSVPSFHEMLAESGIDNISGRLDTVKYILSGGESLKISLAKKMRRNFRNAVMYNVGGPSEATIWSVWHRITDDDLENNLIPYGKPLKNMRYYILSDMMTLCPPGTEGTIYNAGIGLAKGYLGLDDVTRKSFVYFDGIRVYNTGDRGMYLPDGSVKFLGRRDKQVKINGKRIELEGIAQVISEFEGVASCEVILSGSTNELAAFITGSGNADKARMLEELRIKLPDYMVPADIIHIESMPLTKNGKTDIPELDRIYSESRSAGEKAEYISGYENEVAEICSEILGIQNIDPVRNFYELGGNSISAIRIISAVRSRYGINLTIYDILNNPCIREWAKILESRISADDRGSEERAIMIRELPEKAALSKVQEGIWFEVKSSELASNKSTYVLCGTAFMKTERFEPYRLKKAVNRLIYENSVLRTKISEEGNAPCQLYMEYQEYEPELREYDMGSAEASDISESEMLHGRISLDQYPLYSVIAGKCNDGMTIITIGIHHIISDEITLRIIFEKLEEYYTDASDPWMNEKGVKYSDFIAWQNEILETEHYDKDIEYWRKKLKDIPVLELSDKKARWSDFEMDRQKTDIDAQEISDFKALCRRYSSSSFNGISAVMNIAMRYYFCTDRIVIGMASSARSRAETEKIMGCFAVATIMDTEICAEDKFTDVLKKTKDSINESIEHSNLPFNIIVQRSGADKKYMLLPYNILVDCLDTDAEETELFCDIRNAVPEIPVNLAVAAELSGEKNSIVIGYRRAYIDEGFAAELSDTIKDIIRLANENENITVSEIEEILSSEGE